jgi:uncharacterized repeat protein (TIGR03843 family)
LSAHERALPSTGDLAAEDAERVLARGEIALHGLVPWSSNFTFIVSVRDADDELLAIYKPSRGERPLWDFPPGTLCRREVAAYLVSRRLGWPDIPPVVLRNGPHGTGSVQLFVAADQEEHYLTLRNRPEYEDAFRRIALFDDLVNNADRKSGHVLKGSRGRLWAIDHGLTFHVEPKLRTVIWEYAGQRLCADWLGELHALQGALEGRGALYTALAALISAQEVDAFRRRLAQRAKAGVFPLPRRNWRNVPYPVV